MRATYEFGSLDRYDPPGVFATNVNLGWCEPPFVPMFEEEIVETLGDHQIIRDSAGRPGDIHGRKAWVHARISQAPGIKHGRLGRCDVVEIGKQYPDLVMSGGIDKRVLAQGKDAIESHLRYIMPFMVERGGYYPTCDHGVPDDVSFENYMYYRRRVCEMDSRL
jgi:hypothetical protein